MQQPSDDDDREYDDNEVDERCSHKCGGNMVLNITDTDDTLALI